jgi:hypothetical protein
VEDPGKPGSRPVPAEKIGDVRETAPGGTTRRDGTIGLICGVLGLFVLGLLFGIVAIVFGHRARRAGSGLGLAAFILGIIDVALWALALSSWHTSGLTSV